MRGILQSTVFWNIVTGMILVTCTWSVWRARREPLWAEAFRRLRGNRLAVASFLVVSLYVTVGVLDSIAWQNSSITPALSVIDRSFGKPKERTYSAPGARQTTGERRTRPLKGRHLLGTDAVGSDVLYVTLKGCRTALIIAGLTSFLATAFGLLFGLLAGYFGKRVDDAVQYFYTTLDSIPGILLLIALLMVMGREGRTLTQLCIALGVTSWVYLCRLIRGETLKHREREYVRAARALGVSHLRIMFRHILPNLLPVVVINVTLGMSGLILSEVTLTYLGLGVDPSTTGSWGSMIDAARLELAREPVVWWNLIAAFSAAFTLVLALNLFGDALRDAIDPRLRGLEGSPKNG